MRLSIIFLLVANFAIGQRDFTFIYNADSIIKKGTRLHDSEKYADAIKEYDKITRVDPQYGRAQYEKGMTLSAMGNDEETRKFLKECFAKNLQLGQPGFFVTYGSFLSDKKEYEESDKVFAEGVKQAPDFTNLLFNYSILKLRREERQSAIDLLEKTITLNPGLASAHYFLGAFALESGRPTEAIVALLSYLVYSPTGRYAEKAIDLLNLKMGENYLERDKVVYSKAGDDFSSIDEILRNQLPLKAAYKVNSDFNKDPIMRQLQAVCEFAVEHPEGNGFFESTYFPWIRKMMADKQFENLSYYILISREKDLGKQLLSQKKKITVFSDYVNKDEFWNYFGRRKLDLYGNTQEVVVTLTDHRPYVIGVIANGKRQGKTKVVDEFGRITGELNLKDDQLEGMQKYYNLEGGLVNEKEFTAGKKNGVQKEYYKNGQLSVVERYVNDKLSGVSSSYYVNGGKNCEVNFVDGERDGKMVCLYQNGSKRVEETYAAGKLSGVHTGYNEVGDIISQYASVNDKVDGKYIEYYDGKAIKTEAMYVDGKISGNYKSYFADGKVDEERLYENGNLRHISSYLANGLLFSESIYDSGGKMVSESYFDLDKTKYFEEKYRNGEFKSGMQYSASKKAPVEISLSKKPYVMAYADGQVIARGEYRGHDKIGQWDYYYRSGIMRLRENYSAGNRDGLSYSYSNEGLPARVRNYSKDKLSGVYEDYDDGILSGIYHWSDDKKNGPYTTYTPSGGIESEGFYADDEETAQKISYRSDGTVSAAANFIEGVETYSETMDTKGKVISKLSLAGKTGKAEYDKTAILHCTTEFVNGVRNGRNIQKDQKNATVLEDEFVNDMRNNTYRYYGPTGKLQAELQYYCGKYHGLQKWFDFAGALRSDELWILGSKYGKSRRFFQDGAVMIENASIDDKLDGETTYFNHKGMPILKLIYSDNILQYYIRMGKAGALDDKVMSPGLNAEISSNYPNGKSAISFNLKQGNFDGKFMISEEDGKPAFQADYDYDNVNGERIEYYPSGKRYKTERLRNGNLEGLQEYFREDGKPIITLNFKDNNLHGTTTIYNEKSKTIKEYDTDDLISIR